MISEDLYELITTRHSCRRFAKKKVPVSTIDKLIKCGLCAPSAMNEQPWHFVVINDNLKINELTEIAKKAFLNSNVDWRVNWAKQENFSPFYSPSTIILICSDNLVPNSQNDCCFAAMNITLMAQACGLGSCIVEDIRWAVNDGNKKDFGVPTNFSVFLALSIGYPLKQNLTQKIINKSKITILK